MTRPILVRQGSVVRLTRAVERPDGTCFEVGEIADVVALQLDDDTSVVVTLRMADGRRLATTIFDPFESLSD